MHKSCAQEVLDHVAEHPTLGNRKGDEIIRWCTAVIEAPNPPLHPPGKPPGKPIAGQSGTKPKK